MDMTGLVDIIEAAERSNYDASITEDAIADHMAAQHNAALLLAEMPGPTQKEWVLKARALKASSEANTDGTIFYVESSLFLSLIGDLLAAA